MSKILRQYLPDIFFEKKGVRSASTILLIALIMLVVEYYGWQGPFFNFAKSSPLLRFEDKNMVFFMAQVFTSSSFALFFFLIPLCFNFFLPIDPDNNQVGLSLPKKGTLLKDYAPLVIIMIPVLWIACSNPSFYKFYPLYKPTSLKMLLLYEIVYLTQFVSVEFFFRGFGIFRLEKLCPGYGVLLMVIPYSFVHIHKPFGEALGSIIAGVILGRLALKSNSIWPGVLVHACIALSADLFSLYHSGRLAQLF
ncbi:MAG: hypothetical protein CME70_15925 [Halobacteriovorax sp.]|nr:hypothetical protein [Halobacteriovorax sp.]|tara:strand:+ start:52340 stop:53092 length:753 start_codon:yes stop_codon:yes gene_type:complete